MKMLPLRFIPIMLGLVLVMAACQAQASDSRSDATQTPRQRFSAVELPENFRETLVLYASIQRSDHTIRDLYISPEAIADYRAGYPLPDGTTIIIDGYYAVENSAGEPLEDTDGRWIRGEPLPNLHVIQKNRRWQDSDFVSDLRSGDWNFGSFDVLTGQRADESLNTCFNCHNVTPQSDFLYTHNLITSFAVRGEVLELTCDLSGRINCNF